MQDDYLSIITVFVLLLFSAYFSGSETAFFSLNKFKLQKLRFDKKNSFLFSLLEKPKRLLVTIILGNLFVNVLATVIATKFFVKHFGSVYGNSISSVVMITLLLFFGEITPKIMAVNFSMGFAKISAPIMKFTIFLLYPISTLVIKIMNLFLRMLGFSTYYFDRSISEEELRTLIDISGKEGIIKKDEKEMMLNVFDFSDITIDEIITPRIDMVCVDVNITLEELRKVIKENQYSRIPVYEGKIDKIIGILYVKDILPHLLGIKKLNGIRDHLRKCYFVPETKKANSLLKFMQKHRTHIVIVVDEYGGVEGLVTMEDLIEELVGEIHDESDENDKEYIFIDENTVICDAKLNVDEVNEKLGINIPEGSTYNTISGFVMNKLGRLPFRHEKIRLEDAEFIIHEMRGKRIEKIKIIIKKGEDK